MRLFYATVIIFIYFVCYFTDYIESLLLFLLDLPDSGEPGDLLKVLTLCFMHICMYCNNFICD